MTVKGPIMYDRLITKRKDPKRSRLKRPITKRMNIMPEIPEIETKQFVIRMGCCSAGYISFF